MMTDPHKGREDFSRYLDDATYTNRSAAATTSERKAPQCGTAGTGRHHGTMETTS